MELSPVGQYEDHRCLSHHLGAQGWYVTVFPVESRWHLVIDPVPIVISVTVRVKSRDVFVKGPRGELTRSFKHLKLDIKVLKAGREVKVELWFGNRKALACVRSVSAHIQNMITGVTRGFERKMRMVYSHFPINVSIEDNGNMVHIRNFLGEKVGIVVVAYVAEEKAECVV